MLIYEVNLHIDSTIEKEFAAWLPGHIHEILEFEGFLSAEWLTQKPLPDETLPSTARWTIQYHLKDRKSLETYLREQAPAKREDAKKRFGEKFKADRRILEARESFSRG